MRIPLTLAAGAWLIAAFMKATPEAGQDTSSHAGVRFETARTCTACHNGLTAASGEDVSIGTDWRGSMMANSSRDPYWQAAVRRETTDHPSAAVDIEDECSVCHMPMARTEARAAGRKGRVFAHLPVGARSEPQDLLAHDGVSCTVCHQISDRNLGTRDSFTGGFVFGASRGQARPAFGPFQIDSGRTRIMESATGFQPNEGTHIRSSEMCATCHTLYTKARNSRGDVVGELPEQVPYLEWKHSAFAAEQQSCQSCHMPLVREAISISSVLGTPRPSLARHTFRGGNFFMLRMLNRYRTELGVVALPTELEAAVRATLHQLNALTAGVAIDRAVRSGERLDIDVSVRNLAGHKLPTGYPSRRVWLELTVRDGRGREIFQSGRPTGTGAIEGNDNDLDPSRFEPHYLEIRTPDQVQIYESIMADEDGEVTTGLLRAVRYAKDNRLLPRGLDKASAPADVSVTGAAAADPDFIGGADRVRYAVAVGNAAGGFTVDVALRFQPIGFRWARNLAGYAGAETRRFVAYYDAMAEASSEVLARATAVAENDD
jgi:hypothetical protein